MEGLITKMGSLGEIATILETKRLGNADDVKEFIQTKTRIKNLENINSGTVSNAVPTIKIHSSIDKLIVRGKQAWVAKINFDGTEFIVGDNYATCEKARAGLEPVLHTLSRRIQKLIQVTIEGAN